MSIKKSERARCWDALKDLIDGVDHVVSPERLVGVLMACIQDLDERLSVIEAKNP